MAKLAASQMKPYQTGQRLWRTGGPHSVVAGNEASVRKWCAQQHLTIKETEQVVSGWHNAKKSIK